MFKDESVCGTLLIEPSIYTAELNAIDIVLKRMKQKREQNWRIYTDFVSSVKAIGSKKSQNLIQNKINDSVIEL